MEKKTKNKIRKNRKMTDQEQLTEAQNLNKRPHLGDTREIKRDVYGKQQDKILFLPKQGKIDSVI